MVTYPSFTFQYPDNWSVTEENVTQMDETVVLTNERGVTVTFSYIGGIPEDQTGAAAGSTVYRAELSKVGESAFVPGYVQATDYSSLGTFIVAKVEYTGSKEGTESADFTAVDGETLYAVLPESRLGTDSNVSATPQMQFSFWYAGHISMIAESPGRNIYPAGGVRSTLHFGNLPGRIACKRDIPADPEYP